MRRCKHSMGLLKCLLVFSPLVRTRMSSCWLIICSPVGAAGIFNFALTLVQFNKNVYVFNIALPSGQAVKCMHKRLKRLKLLITAGIVVQSQLLLFIIYICFIKQRIGNKIWSRRMKSTGKHLRLKRSSKPREDSRYLGSWTCLWHLSCWCLHLNQLWLLQLTEHNRGLELRACWHCGNVRTCFLKNTKDKNPRVWSSEKHRVKQVDWLNKNHGSVSSSSVQQTTSSLMKWLKLVYI